MTAEIAIVNQNAVVLAADSAVTIGKDRVWKTNNKLFSLSPANDIGIMIYGSADFIGFPWETVIKLFRTHSKEVKFNNVSECRDEFINFLRSDDFSAPEMEEIYSSYLLVSQIEDLCDGIEKKPILKFRKILKKRIVDNMSKLIEYSIIDELDLNYFRGRYIDRIKDYAAEEFECHITNEMLSMICNYLYESFRRERVESNMESGVIFAGFGKHELFPVVLHCIVDGKDDGYLRHWMLPNSCDFNASRMLRGTIIPFAQGDMTRLFLEGVFGQHIRWMERAISGILDIKTEDIVNRYVPDEEKIVETKIQKDDNRKMTEGLMTKFMEYRQEEYVDPVMKIVSNLPKEDMAQMAEALVEITSLRRKVGSSVQSVSGPVDVAVISKGDGFIWIKRKNYFSVDLNRDFLYRKYGSAGMEIGRE